MLCTLFKKKAFEFIQKCLVFKYSIAQIAQNAVYYERIHKKNNRAKEVTHMSENNFKSIKGNVLLQTLSCFFMIT